MSAQPYHIERLPNRSVHHQVRYGLIGPDDRVLHTSWARASLKRRCERYNEIYGLGFQAGRKEAGT